jgi:hypothetical protein
MLKKMRGQIASEVIEVLDHQAQLVRQMESRTPDERGHDRHFFVTTSRLQKRLVSLLEEAGVPEASRPK